MRGSVRLSRLLRDPVRAVREPAWRGLVSRLTISCVRRGSWRDGLFLAGSLLTDPAGFSPFFRGHCGDRTHAQNSRDNNNQHFHRSFCVLLYVFAECADQHP